MSITSELRSVLAVFARHPRAPEGGYGPEVRSAVAAYATALRRAGKTWAEVATGLPVSANTARTWMMAAEAACTPGGLVPVTVTAAPTAGPEPARLVLVTPSGYRLEGLDAAIAFQLLRGLG